MPDSNNLDREQGLALVNQEREELIALDQLACAFAQIEALPDSIARQRLFAVLAEVDLMPDAKTRARLLSVIETGMRQN